MPFVRLRRCFFRFIQVLFGWARRKPLARRRPWPVRLYAEPLQERESVCLTWKDALLGASVPLVAGLTAGMHFIPFRAPETLDTEATPLVNLPDVLDSTRGTEASGPAEGTAEVFTSLADATESDLAVAALDTGQGNALAGEGSSEGGGSGGDDRAIAPPP